MNKKLYPTTQALYLMGLWMLVQGCAQTYRAEPVESKMGRYQPATTSKNRVPELPAPTNELQALWSRPTGRMPASISPKPIEEGAVETSANQLTNQSNKRFYFMTLFSQYESLRSHPKLAALPEIRLCPNFHTQLVNHREQPHLAQPVWQTKTYPSDLITKLTQDESLLALYPEFGLPLTEENLRPRVVDLVQKNHAETEGLVTKALQVHARKTHAELSELCEFGVSENYYIFENLVGHQERQMAGPSLSGLHSLLKSSVVFNHALLTSLASTATSPSRAPASASLSVWDYGHEGLQRLQAEWTSAYFQKLGQSKN